MQIAVNKPWVPNNPLVRQAFSPRVLAGLGVFPTGLGATVNQCEDWRKAAGWITPGLTDEQRRDAAQSYNNECRNTVAATAVTAAAAIAAGSGSQQVSQVALPANRQPGSTAAMREAEEYLRTHSHQGTCSWSPSDLIPVPQCGPLDGACLQCSYQLQQVNAALRQNVKNKCGQLNCEYDKARNAAAGHPSSRDCAREYPIATVPSATCATQFSGGYVSPAATIDTEGNIITDDSGPSFYTLLPAEQQTESMALTTQANGANRYAGVENTVVPPPASGQGLQPGVVQTFGPVSDMFGQISAGTGLSPWLLVAVAAGVIYMVVKK